MGTQKTEEITSSDVPWWSFTVRQQQSFLRDKIRLHFLILFYPLVYSQSNSTNCFIFIISIIIFLLKLNKSSVQECLLWIWGFAGAAIQGPRLLGSCLPNPCSGASPMPSWACAKDHTFYNAGLTSLSRLMPKNNLSSFDDLNLTRLIQYRHTTLSFPWDIIVLICSGFG